MVRRVCSWAQCLARLRALFLASTRELTQECWNQRVRSSTAEPPLGVREVESAAAKAQKSISPAG